MTPSLNKLKTKFPFPSKKPNMPKNNKITMGWFTANNQALLKKYLINRCSTKSIVIEFGTWLGMSANFISENTTDDTTVICVDWWKGDTSIGNRKDEDELYNRYIDNVWEHRKKIIPVRMDGKKAAIYLSKLGIKPDLIYLDMGHSYEEVIEDLKVIIPSFPNTIIVGDDYLYWPGVKKAVLESRYKYDIPYLNVDKNCYALLYKDDLKYMTYNNNNIGKNIEWYSNQEIQYSLLPKYNNNKRIFIIPLNKSIDLKRYKDIISTNTNDIYIIVQSFKSIFTKYNIGYKYYIDNFNELDNISFIFVDPFQIIKNKDYKTCNGLLSITTSLNNNKETFSSLGNLSIDINTMKKIKLFPNNIKDIYANRHFFYTNIINNKIIIYQLFVEKKITNLEIGHLTSNKKIMKKLGYVKSVIKKEYTKINKQNIRNINKKLKSKQIGKNLYYVFSN